MAAYYNNCHPVKDGVNKKNSGRDSTEHQEVKNNLITHTADEEESETQAEKPVINLHHTFRSKLVRKASEEEVRAKPDFIEEDAKRVAKQARFHKRQVEAAKFCKENLEFTNYRIPVYESDEDRKDRLTFETLKSYAECSKYVPSKSKTRSKKDEKQQQQRHREFDSSSSSGDD